MTGRHPVRVERDGPVAIVRLDRPPANALDLETCRAFDAAWDEALAGEPGAVALTGTGAFFSGGLDLRAVPLYAPDEQVELIRTVNRFVAKLYGCPRPVVGAINGHAVAAGFILTLATDYRVGPTGTASFGLTEARVGIPFPAGPMIVLKAELGPQDARVATLRATNFGPDEALARGVLDELQPPEAVRERALAVAHDMAGMPAAAYTRIKQQLRGDAIDALAHMNEHETDPMLAGWFGASAVGSAAAVLDGDPDG